jgi:hypothetical protein
MPHLPLTHHKPSKHDSPHGTKIKIKVPKCDQEIILDSKIKELQSSSNIAHAENMIYHTVTSVLIRNEPLDERAGIIL